MKTNLKHVWKPFDEAPETFEVSNTGLMRRVKPCRIYPAGFVLRPRQRNLSGTAAGYEIRDFKVARRHHNIREIVKRHFGVSLCINQAWFDWAEKVVDEMNDELRTGASEGHRTLREAGKRADGWEYNPNGGVEVNDFGVPIDQDVVGF